MQRGVGPVSLCLVLLVAGCESTSFYQQAIRGQIRILIERQPIDAILADGATTAQLREGLVRVRSILDFAEAELRLPVGDSYRTYVDVGDRFVVWNLFAAPEFKMELHLWCYPIAGCVSYRGYFDRQDAMAHAERLAAAGMDVYVGGVAAYSTLGWFDDPVMNTFLERSPERLAALIFHELAHKVVYVPGDATFNESFASAVARYGVEKWLNAHGRPEALQDFLATAARRRAFTELVARYREELQRLYESDRQADEMRRRKQESIAAFRDDYRTLRDAWEGHDDFGSWLTGDVNNARLMTVSTYSDFVGGFMRLLRQLDYDLLAFYAEAKSIGDEDPAARSAVLRGE